MVRLGLANLYSSMCTHAYVLQRFVHRAAVRRVAPSRGRCRKPGALKTQAPHAGSGLGKGRLKLGRSLGARRASLCGVVVAGSSLKNACFRGTPVNTFFCGVQATATAAALW